MIKSLFFLFLVSVLNTTYSNNTHANDILDEFFQTTQNFQAQFSQKVLNSYGKIREQSKGRLIIKRPDKFILAYDSPAEQKYISNGKTIWIYDVELEQVSIKELDETLGDSPALLLSSNSNVYKHYDVSNITNTSVDNEQWIELRAKKEEMTFEKVLLAFNGTVLVKMIMHDSFEQITELTFADIQVNKTLSLQEFDFVVPQGVDVIGGTSAR